MSQTIQENPANSPLAKGIRKNGEFCWINILTPQPAQAREFYSKLLGWTFSEMPGNMGHLIKVNGRDIGGLFDLNGPQTPPGTKPQIGVMIKVTSADATVEKVISLGGKAMPAFDIMDKGRMAVCFDPNGAQFDVWEPKASPGTDADSSLHGASSWFETMTSSADRAAAFYSKLFGWSPELMPITEMKYTVFKLDGVSIAGMFQIMPEMGEFPSQWLTYFTVKDAAASAKEAVRLGASICMEMTTVQGVGRFCTLVSPQGVMFYIIQYIP